MKSFEEIEKEILELEASPFVNLARKADAIREQRMNYLIGLRELDRRGRNMLRLGMNESYLNAIGGEE